MTTSPRPEARRPRLRERSEAAKNSVAPAFNAAWATPTRRGRASVSLQSVNPVIAEPSAPARPRVRLASAARAIPEWPRRSPRASSSNVAVQAPRGMSVRTGCSGCPSQVPCRKFLTPGRAGPSASKKLLTAGCRRSAAESSQSCPSSQAVILRTTVGRRGSFANGGRESLDRGRLLRGPLKSLAKPPHTLFPRAARPLRCTNRVRSERPLIVVTPERLDRQSAGVEKRADLRGIPCARHESRPDRSLCPLLGAIEVAIPGLPEIAAGPSPRLADAQKAAGVPDPALGDLDPPAAPVKTFQHEASLGGKLIRDPPECSPPVPNDRPMGERIARSDDQIKSASEDGVAHVGRDEAGAGPGGAPTPSAREHLDGDVDSNRRSVTRERAGDPSQPAAGLQNPIGAPSPGETSPESQMRVRRGLLLVDGKDLAVVGPEVFDRHGSRCIPLPWRACSSSPARRRTCAVAAARSSESPDSGGRSNPAATTSTSSPLPRAAPFPSPAVCSSISAPEARRGASGRTR